MTLSANNRPITLEIIVSKNCSNRIAANSLEESVLKLKRIWLDKEEITRIENLELLGSVTHIHLDFNHITVIENLETLSATLQHLSLKGNNIENIGAGLRCLTKLMSLDLSENNIKMISSSEIPSSVTFLNLLDNPVVTNGAFNEDLFLKGFPGMKVYNKKVLHSVDDDDSDDEEVEEAEDESEIGCLQDITRQLKKSSQDRQIKIEENHQNKVSTLALLKTEMEAHKNTTCTVSPSEKPLAALNTVSDSSNNGRNCLPPLERPLSSQSLSKKSGQLKPLSRKPSSPSLSQLKSPASQPSPTAPLTAPKRSEKGTSLRQPLEMELVKADDFDDYLCDVNKKFADIRNQFQGL